MGLAAGPAEAASLNTGPGPRPGRDLLYAKPARAPQLTNRKPARARPILVSGASAYRRGEFLYQDFLYDDHGACAVADPPTRRPAATSSRSRTAPTRTRPTRATRTTRRTWSSCASSRCRIASGTPASAGVRLGAGVGLWDAAGNRYLLPRASADATHPGGAGTESGPAAFFNIAFRFREPYAKPGSNPEVVTDAAWWRDKAQGAALAAHDISAFHANVNFKTLACRKTNNRRVPKGGPMDRILASRFETAQGADFSEACLIQAATCKGQYTGRLQPHNIYVPRKRRPGDGWGMTLLLHSLSSPYNEYYGSRNQTQFGERGAGSIVITPESRGPDENFENDGAADVFEVWADVARRYRLNPSWTVTTGYSMGGVGSLKLGSPFPDLFARIQPTVGFEDNTDVLAFLRNVPVLMRNNHGDELVNDAFWNGTAAKLDSLGYRYEVDGYSPARTRAAARCSRTTPSSSSTTSMRPPRTSSATRWSNATRRTSPSRWTPAATIRSSGSSATTPTGCRT